MENIAITHVYIYALIMGEPWIFSVFLIEFNVWSVLPVFFFHYSICTFRHTSSPWIGHIRLYSRLYGSIDVRAREPFTIMLCTGPQSLMMGLCSLSQRFLLVNYCLIGMGAGWLKLDVPMHMMGRASIKWYTVIVVIGCVW